MNTLELAFSAINEWLETHGINDRNIYGEPMLIRFQQVSNPEFSACVATYLLEIGADPNATDAAGRSVLYWGRNVELYVRWGADVDFGTLGQRRTVAYNAEMINAGADVFGPALALTKWYRITREKVMSCVLAHPGLCEDLARMVAEMLV